MVETGIACQEVQGESTFDRSCRWRVQVARRTLQEWLGDVQAWVTSRWLHHQLFMFIGEVHRQSAWTSWQSSPLVEYFVLRK
jgi:hypothetical protein